MRVLVGLLVELDGEKRRLVLVLHLLDGLGHELLLGEFAVGVELPEAALLLDGGMLGHFLRRLAVGDEGLPVVYHLQKIYCL